jgi:hypothetical protein
VCTVLNSVWLDLPQGILVNRLWSESGVGLLNLGLQGIVYRTGGVSGNRVQLHITMVRAHRQPWPKTALFV